MFVVLLGVSSLLIFVVLYFIGVYNEAYWKKRAVPFYSRNKTWGPFWDLLFTGRAFFEIIGDIYKEYPEAPAVGFGSINSPSLLIRDPTNIKHVMQVDFEAFQHKGFEAQPGDPLADSIPFMNGKRWKLMRQNMTPLFSAAKLKSMFTVMDKSGQDFVKFLHDNPEKLQGDVFATLSTYCCAAIGASVFGITSKSVFDSPFLDMAQKALKPTVWSNIRFVIFAISPWLFRTLNMSLFSEHEKFFIGAVKHLIDQRKQDGIKVPDFADLCVNLQQKGEMKDSASGISLEPTYELLSAQAFFFFIAGVEPSATAIFSTLIEIGRNPDVQQRLHNEIDNVFEKNENKLSYDCLSEFKYLEMVLNEGLRILTPIGILGRMCVRESVLPVGNIKISKGTKIFVAPYHLQRDPKIFSEPDKFTPERFDSKVLDQTYLPFGRGSRICIGERFAKMQIITGLIYLLHNFTIKTHILDGSNEIKFKKEQFQVRPGNVDIEFVPRKIKAS